MSTAQTKPGDTPPSPAPLVRALMATSRERHADMVDLVSGLPAGALDWRPAPDAASLAGLVLHIVDVEGHVASLAAGEDEQAWPGENGSRMDETASEAGLVKTIEAVDAALDRGLSLLPSRSERAAAVLEDLDHAAMHHGQMQLTRHLWEGAHPGSPSGYQHWR